MGSDLMISHSEQATVAPQNCSHDNTALVYRVQGKQKNFLHQCQQCGVELIQISSILEDPGQSNSGQSNSGHLAQELIQTTVRERIAAKPFDWSLRRSGDQLEYSAQREKEKRAWQDRYKQYLESKEWQNLRKEVLFRCQGICEGCRKVPAAEVHHLTYERMGHEMLFDLVGVCRGCHRKIHPEKDLT